MLYLWQGAFPGEEEGEEAGATTGSGLARWQAERRAAMQTLLSYRKARYGQPVPAARLVWAGHEPQEFLNHFPYWTHNPDTARANREVSEFCCGKHLRLTKRCATMKYSASALLSILAAGSRSGNWAYFPDCLVSVRRQ